MAKSIALALAGLAVSTSASFAEPVGGHLGLSYSGFMGRDVDDFTKLQLDASGEFAITPGISIQGDGLFADYGGIDRYGKMLGIHGVFNLVDDSAAGVYFGREWLGSDGQTFYGAEYTQEFGGFDFEGYVGGIDSGSDHGFQIGAAGSIPVGNIADVGLKFDRFDVDDEGVSRIALTGGISTGNGFDFNAEVGTADINGGSSEAFFSLGGRLTFGGDDGATFGQRGVLTLLPGL